MCGKWESIETAPRDGTTVILTDGKGIAIGTWVVFRVEGDWKHLGYDEGCKFSDGKPKMGPRFMERVPNPNAGVRHEGWSMNGVAWFPGDNDFDDDGVDAGFNPTRWGQMFELPE